LLVSSDGETVGSVSFGCVEADVAAHADEVLATGTPRLVAYGINDEDAFGLGLTCGGTMEVFIEPWDDLRNELGDVPPDAFVGAMATVITGPSSGTHGLFDSDGHLRSGSIPPAIAEGLASEIRATVAAERAQLVGQGPQRVYVEPVMPPPRLLIYGAGHTAQALTSAAAAIGFSVVVADHRPSLADSGAYAAASELIVGWPAEVVQRVAPDARTFAVCLAHNPEVEDELLPLLLGSQTRYIGVLGSRRTHTARVERLRAAGLAEDQLARLHGPVGLSIGAATPEEIAISIVGEIVSVRRGHVVAAR
jgi:xanthine dehydrogenase accessory factor